MADPTTVDALSLGDHVCWTFDDHERHLEALARFVRAGLAQDQKVLYLTDTFLPAAFLAAVETYGVDADDARRSGRLVVSTADESYLARGAFDPEQALRGWTTAVEEARRQGYAGLRVAADMGWTVRPIPGIDRLAWYEAQANRIFSQGEALALCCYDRRLFTARELERVGMAHPGTAQADAGSGDEWRPLLRMRRTSTGLSLSGEADMTNRDALATVLRHLVEDVPTGNDPVVVDVSGLTFADLGAARALASAVTSSGGRMRLEGSGPFLVDLLAFLDQPDEEAATADGRVA
ncbi:hypothetical protein GCM10009530_36800 [Microbispora corallina]|uniref:STAS domain-containing protein n=1 Tax=Microbispora corallina TaxID=83302 RepID=A0ABQ4FYE5_9ACTN|nr:MEDS domain-containing protein [Microbispora corallina]GIH39783.1 hypothetical protein Mco01_27830 [Microbispora corallina]